MKKRNSLRLRRALSAFSVLLVLFSQSAPAYANVVATSGSSEAVLESTTETTTSESEEEQVTPPTPVIVDKTKLEQQLSLLKEVMANAQQYRPSTYPAAKINQLYQLGSELVAATESDQQTVDECTNEIENVRSALELKADKTNLQALLTKATSFKESDYTPASFKSLKTQIDLATQISKNEDATNEQVATVQIDLQKAIDGLEKVVTPKPDPKPKPQPKPDPVPTPKPKPNQSTANKPNKPSTSTNNDKSKTNSTQAKTPKPANQGPSQKENATSLDKDLVVDSLTDSNLNGFELPLLSSFKDKKQAALIAAALKTLNKPFEKNGKAPEAFNNLSLPNYLYHEIFGITLGKTYDEMIKVNQQTTLEKAQPGDLLFWQNDKKINKVALYLGQGKYMLATDENHEALKEQRQLKEEAKEDADKENNNENKQTELPGVQIFTLQGYEVNDAGVVKINDDADKADEKTTSSLSEKYGVSENPNVVISMPTDLNLTEKGQETLDSYAATIDFKVNPITQRFIESIADDARELGLKYDVFASVMIAQAILESGSGASGLSRAPYYNLFGIKGSHAGSSVAMKTMEDNGNGELYQITANFRSYPSYKESLKDYVELIRGGIAGNDSFYKAAWRSEAGNYLQATDHLMGKYATDTQYSNKLNSIIAAYHLTQFDEPKTPEGTQTGVVIQSRQNIPTYYRNKMIFPDYDGKNYNTSGSYPVGQCTWYVYNRITQLGGRVDNFMGNGGEWGQKGAKLGYKTTSTPKVGYAVSFHPGIAGSSTTYGHVAFVEAVGPDGILVSEGNVISPTTISYRIIPNSIARSSNVTYIAPR